MKKLLALLFAACLMLTGCASRDIHSDFESFSAALSGAESISFTANLRAEYEHKSARFTLGYEENSEGGTVTVLAPELIKGIQAHVSPGGTELIYDSVVLDTGSLDSFGLSPLSGLPLMVKAMKTGHLESFRKENGLRVLELTVEDGLKCSIWFDENMTPLRAETASGGRVTIYTEISDWNAE